MRLLSRVLAAVLLATVLFHSAPVEAATRPSAPRSVKATPLNKAVKVTWAAPSSPGTSAINAYAVQRRNTTSSPWVTVKYTGATARAWTETGLVNGARFYYRVLARNGSGWGTASAQVSAVPRTVPGAVPELEADNYDGALGAYWKAAAANGATIDRYEVQASLDGVTWSAPITSTTLRTSANALQLPLTLGKRYWLRARAHNAAGYGPFTGAGPYRVYTKPGQVTGLDATVTSGQVELRWTPPAFNRDAGIPAASGYRVEVSADGGTTWTTDSEAASSPWTVDGLTNGVAYRFRVSALFSKLTGPAAEVAPDAPTGPPTVPQDLALSWNEVSGYTLAWQPPANDGGKPLTRYVVEYGGIATPPPLPTITVGSSVDEVVVAELALDNQFRIRACNGPADADCGPWTAPVGPLTGPVGNLAASQAMAGTLRTVTLDWDAPSNGAGESYDVLRSDDGGTTYATLATGLTATGYDDTSTVAGTDYTYKVVPHGGGTGFPSTTTITTGAAQSVGLPADPLALTEGGAPGTVTVSLGVVSTVDVVVALSTDSPAVTVAPSVTIPAGSLTTDVEVSAVEDGNAISEHVTVTASIGVSGPQATATVDVTDNDTPAILTTSADVVVPLGTTNSTVMVTLDRQPAGTVTVTATPGSSPVRVSVPAEPLVFTPENWSDPQPLAITGEAKGGTTVTLSAPGVTNKVINISVTNAP